MRSRLLKAVILVQVYEISNFKGSNYGSGVRYLEFKKAVILVQVYEISNLKGRNSGSSV
jgi:hypothetical protein